MRCVILSVFCIFSTILSAQNKKIHGVYLQWGYNSEWFTKSKIHVKMSNGNNFYLHNTKAHDKPDFDAIVKKPLEISIPQYNYRIGFYLNKARSKAFEINFDHIKYVVTDGQKVRVTGSIDGKKVNGDSILNRDNFLHIEHTDGGNLLHFNYVEQRTIKTKRNSDLPMFTAVGKLGAGINIPRTDFTWKGDRLNNDFHIAGYNVSTEWGLRFYATKHLFLEGSAKGGYVRYVNALANTETLKGNRISHGFGYFEVVGLIAYQFGR